MSASDSKPVITWLIHVYDRTAAERFPFKRKWYRFNYARATDAEKQSQLKRLADFKKRHEAEAPEALQRLQKVALSGDNIFAELMETVKTCSLGQITQALYDVGGQYRRNM